MPMTFETKTAIDEIRRNDPSFNSFDDEELYYHLKRENPDLTWDELDVAESRSGLQNTSPSFLNSFQEWFDYGIDENSYDWMKSAYNNSLTGLTEQLSKGEERYKLEDYDPNIVEDIGSMALSFFMPLDFLSMAAGGGIGGLAAKGVVKKAGQEFTKRGIRSVMAESAIKQAGSLAVYEGAMGGVQSALNDENVLTGIAEGAFHGAVLGGISGGVGGGLAFKNAELLSGFTKVGKRAAKVGDEATEMLTAGDKAKKIMYGMPGQIAAESGVFTAAEQAEAKLRGEDVNLETIIASFGKNIGLFSLLKGQRKLWDKALNEGKKHITMLEEAEKEKFRADEDGATMEGRMLDNSIKNLKDQKEATADPMEKAAIDQSIEDLVSQKTKVSDTYTKIQKKFKDEKKLIKDLEKDVKTAMPDDARQLGKRAVRYMNGLNTLLGGTSELLKGSEDSVVPIYEGAKGSILKAQKNLELIQNQIADLQKEAFIPKDKKWILEQSKELGIEEFISDKFNLGKEKDRLEATKIIKKERAELLQEKREEITPLTPEGEAVAKILTTEEFTGKDWSTEATTPEMRKDVEARVRGTEKEKGLAEVDAEVIADTGGFESGSKESSKYNNSKNIVRNFIQNILPMQIGKTLRGGAFVGNPVQKARRLNVFAKWLATRGKEFKDVTNEDYQIYLAQKPTHVTELQQLREFLQANQIASRQFNLTRDVTAGYAKKYIGESPEGITFDAHAVDKNSITFVQPKTNQPITKYISTKLKGLLTDLKKTVGIKAPDINQHFITKDGKLINNDVLNSFVDKIFGAKGLRDRARLFRDSLTSWAGKEFGKSSKEVELLKQEVLGDKANVDVISKAYVKGDYHTDAVKLVKRFIAEINKGQKKAKGEGFYSTYEIAQGLKKLKGKKDVIFKANVGTKKKPVYKTVTLDAMTAEGMARYLIETSPRLNEVVPSKEAKSVKYQLESAASRMGLRVGELESQIKHFNEVMPEVKVKLVEDLGKYQGEYIVGRIAGHTAEIVKGRASADAIPHEMTHRVVDVLRALGDKRSKNLIREGESKFGSEEKLVQAIGEFVAGRMRNKSMASKVRNWIQKFWSNMKTKLGWHTPEDIKRVIGEKVLKGEKPEGELKDFQTKYKTDSKESLDRKSRINNRIHAEKLEDIPVNDLEQIKMDIFGKTDLKGYVKESTLEQMQKYKQSLDAHKDNGGSSTKSIPFNIEEINDKYHVRPESAKEYLKLMGVEEGMYEYASPETAKAYESFIRNNYDKPILGETSQDFILANKNKKLANAFGRAVMPVWLVLRKYGGKPGQKIAKSLLDHEWSEHVLFKGPGDEALILINKRLGRKTKHVSLWDVERTEARIELRKQMEAEGKTEKEIIAEGGLTKEQQDFYDKSLNDVKSDEGRAYDTWKTLSEFYWTALERELGRHQTPEGVNRIMATLKKKKVEGYMTRRLTRKAIEYLVDDSSYIEKLVDKNIRGGAATKEARIRGEGKSETEIKLIEKRLKDKGSEEGKKFYEDVRTELYDAITFGFTNVKNPHLIERSTLLSEYAYITNHKGNREKIKVYDDSLEATASTYVRRMSKYLASVRLFPEWTGVGNKYKINTSRRRIMEQIEQNPTMGGYAVKSIKRQLGIDRSEMQSLSQPIYKGLSIATHISAAAGLSSPLSGVKNIMIGIPRSIGDFGLFNTMRGIRNVFNTEAWHDARRAGSLEYGSKTLELETVGWRKATMANMFKYVNLMTPSENFNRIASSHAGKLYFAQAQSVLRGEKGMFRMGTNKNRMKRLMDELWHLDAEQIKFLETTKDLTSKENRPIYNEIMHKVGHFSHVSSQGGTSTVLLPLWMSSKEAKPMTLFQRMATATTIDSYRNFVKPIVEFGNIMPLARAALAHSVSGAALYFLYDELFGKEKPIGSKLKQGDDFSNIMMNLWRSEFLGMFGEILSPYERDLAVPISTPIIYRNLVEAGNQYRQWALGGKTVAMASKDYLKQSVVFYSQFLDTMPKVHASEYYKNFMKLRSMTRQFKTKRDFPMYSAEGMISRRQPYYRDLKDAMMFGTEEDIAKRYWQAINFIVTDMEKTNPYTRPSHRMKEAKKAVKSVIKHYNPLNISDSQKGTTKSIENQFLDWLTPENKALAMSVKKTYEYRLRQYMKIINNYKYKQEWSPYPYS